MVVANYSLYWSVMVDMADKPSISITTDRLKYTSDQQAQIFRNVPDSDGT